MVLLPRPEIERLDSRFCAQSGSRIALPRHLSTRVLENYIDENIGRPMLPSVSDENAYLNRVVKLIYELCALRLREP